MGDPGIRFYTDQLTAGGFCRRRREACKMDMEQLSLFDTEAVYDPLASRMRPEDLDCLLYTSDAADE